MPLCAGHRNYQTVKGVSFAGASDEYVVSGSDDGHIYIWSRDGVLRQWLEGDRRIVNCIEPHPQLPLVMATSGEHALPGSALQGIADVWLWCTRLTKGLCTVKLPCEPEICADKVASSPQVAPDEPDCTCQSVFQSLLASAGSRSPCVS